jgi:hypothetical protein
VNGLLYPWGKRPQYSLDSGLGGSKKRFGHGEEKILAPTGIRTPTPLLFSFGFCLLFYLSFVAVAFSLYTGMGYTMAGRKRVKEIEEKLRLANSVWDAVEREEGKFAAE